MRTSMLGRAPLFFAIAFAFGAALSTGGTALAAGVEPAKATPVQREQAQSRFVKGRELYNAKKYDAALVELSASLDIVASPNTRLYVGRCLREMGRVVAAYVELGRAAVEAKELQHDDARYAKAGEAALEERARLEPKLGFAQISIARAGPDTVLKVQGDEVRRGGWSEPVPIKPGAATVVVETPGHALVTKEINISAGERVALAIDADADAVPAAAATAAPDAQAGAAASDASGTRATLRPLAFATAGVAVAGLATFLVAGAMANGTYSTLEDDCGAGPCPPGHESDISAGRTQQTLANVGLVVFALAGAASVTLFVVTSSKSAPATAASARVTAKPSFVGLEGRF